MTKQQKTSFGTLALIVIFSCLFSTVFVYLWFLLSYNTGSVEVNTKQILIYMIVSLISLPQILITINQLKKMLTTYSPEQCSLYDSQKQKTDKLWLLFWYLIFASLICTVFAPIKNATYFASLHDYLGGKIYWSLAVIIISAFIIFMLGLSIIEIYRKIKNLPPVGTIEGHQPLSSKEAIFTTSLNVFTMMFALGWLIMVFLRYGKYI